MQQNSSKTFKIALGSMNSKKLMGVSQAFPGANVIAQNVDLQISQPFDKATTENCAIIRAKAMQSEFPDYDLFIGIQNGIWEKTNGNEVNKSVISADPNIEVDKYENKVDGACIHMFGKGLEPISIWTEEVFVVSFFTKGKNGEWSNMSDPHLVVSSITRSDFIRDAISKYLFSFFFAALKSKSKTQQ